MSDCVQCGKTNIGSRKSKRFCSLKCNRLFNKFTPNKTKSRNKSCGYCSKLFVDDTDKNRMRYCSKTCYNNFFYADKYKLTPEEHQKLLSKNKCDICNKTPLNGKLAHIDHDWITGKVRGLLCHNCNIGIGNLKHDLKILNSCIKYLKESE